MIFFKAQGRLGNQIFQYAFLQSKKRKREKIFSVGFDELLDVLAPIKQECSFKFRLLIMRLIFSLKLDVYPGSIFP